MAKLYEEICIPDILLFEVIKLLSNQIKNIFNICTYVKFNKLGLIRVSLNWTIQFYSTYLVTSLWTFYKINTKINTIG